MEILLVSLFLVLALTLIYAAIFSRKGGRSQDQAKAADASKESSLVVGASGSMSMGDAAFASSWKVHPDLGIDDTSLRRPKWGSFRPGIYFGMKEASVPSMDMPVSPVTGILWGTSVNRMKGLRHQTNQDELTSFDWMEHDGKAYGTERLIDGNLGMALDASFVIPSEMSDSDTDTDTDTDSGKGGDVVWAQRISVSSMKEKNADTGSLQFYFTTECITSSPEHLDAASKALNVEKVIPGRHKEDGSVDKNAFVAVGTSPSLGGPFSLTVKVRAVESTVGGPKQATARLSLSYYGMPMQDMTGGVDLLQSNFRHKGHGPSGVKLDEGSVERTLYSARAGAEGAFSNFLHNKSEGGTSFLAFQARGSLEGSAQGKGGFVVDAVLHRHDPAGSLDDVCEWHDLQSTKNGRSGIPDTTSQVNKWLSTASSSFSQRFDETFPLKDRIQKVINQEGEYVEARMSKDQDVDKYREFDKKDVAAAKVALSSMLGGVGYFYGTPRIGDAIDVDNDFEGAAQRKAEGENIEDREVVSLLTATPSRTSFPRGFLWDEGFHQLLISQWDDELSLLMVQEWLQAMYVYKDGSDVESEEEKETEAGTSGFNGAAKDWGGWIPREMILGHDAVKRVPEEFITQRVNIANPPTLLLVLEKLVHQYSRDSARGRSSRGGHAEKAARMLAALRKLYPALNKWVTWFLLSQRGGDWARQGDKTGGGRPITGFRWRGRSLSDGKVLPNTLASGLDDYPRGPIPSDYERHVDLHCWMVKAVDVMATLGRVLGMEDTPDHAKYVELTSQLASSLDEIHWHEGTFPALEDAFDKTDEEDVAQDGDGDEDLAAAEAEEEAEGVSAKAIASNKSSKSSGLYADIGLQGVAGDEMITGVVIRCARMADRTSVDVVAPIEPVVAMQQFMSLAKKQKEYVERKRKNDPALADEPPPVLPEPPQAVCPTSHPQYIQAVPDEHGKPQMREVYVIGGRSGNKEVSLQMIGRLGYVNLFPLLLQLLPVPTTVTGKDTDAASLRRLDSLLELVESPELLWSPFGLRSMAKIDAFYQKRNSPGDAPYWRGPIWININYLALAALFKYGGLDQTNAAMVPDVDTPSGRTMQRARHLYHQLRSNVVSTVLSNYHRTGFFWEQYDDRSGEGIRGHPFCGWTALVLNIMAERY